MHKKFPNLVPIQKTSKNTVKVFSSCQGARNSLHARSTVLWALKINFWWMSATVKKINTGFTY